MDHLKIAEVMDAYRLIPRVLMLLVYVFTGFYVYLVTLEFFAVIRLPTITDWKLTAYAGFAALTIPALTALATGLTKVYMNSGRKWNGVERRNGGDHESS